MKIILSWAALIILLYAAQTSLLTFVGYGGVSVNLMLLVTVSAAFLYGCDWGAAMGFFTGLLQDVTTGSFFGCSIFSFMLIGFFFGKFSTHVFKEQSFFPIISAPFVAAIHFFIMAGFVYLLGYKLDLIQSMQKILLPLAIYQFVFAWLVHKIVYEFDKFTKQYF